MDETRRAEAPRGVDIARSLRRWLGALACALACPVAELRAQSAPPPSVEWTFPYDSGWLRPDPQLETVLASATLRVNGASWLRLRFGTLILGAGTRLRLTSFADGAIQELDGDAARQWRHTSAYFNGDAVQLDVVAAPGAEPARVVLRSIWSAPLLQPQFSICGPLDDRTPSLDPRVARLLPVGCSGWLTESPAHCLSTAGHCAGALLQVAQFRVPPSDPSGAMQHPPPEDQYAVDASSIQRQNAGVGQDWGYFGCFANAGTGRTPFERQRAAFALATTPAPASALLRVTGFGIDYDTPTASYAQQSHVGSLVARLGTTLRHDADTTGGNSGSPIVLEGSSTALGVHTHGGCSSSGTVGANHGTTSDHPQWAQALAQPTGVCAPSASVSSFCISKLNSQGCLPTLGAAGSPSSSGGAGSFTIHAHSLLNRKLGYFLYGAAPRAAAFQGGVLCVAPPRRRSPPCDSGGSASGVDCSGALSLDMGALLASSSDPLLAYGGSVYVQCWSRDPFDPFGASLSDGLRFVVGP